jgi:hypothetical protein
MAYTYSLTLTFLHQNKKCEKKHRAKGLNVSSSDSKKCTLAQGLVALNQLTHTNCFWIFWGLWDRPWTSGEEVGGWGVYMGLWLFLGRLENLGRSELCPFISVWIW